MSEIKFSSNYELFLEDQKVIAEAPEIDNLPRVWVNAAKEGQIIDVNGELCSMTRQGLESSLGTWKNGKIYDNHKKERSGFKIYDDRFESPFLAFLLDEHTAKSLEDAEGGSIDGIALNVEKKRILKLRGVGYSILETGLMPSCSKDAKCGIPIAGETPDVNIKQSDSNINDNTEKRDSNKNTGGKENMVEEKEPEVTYSKEQVADIRAAAVAELAEQLGNEHKVAMTEIGTAHTTELDAIKTAHTTELETERSVVMKQAAMIESLSTMYGLSPEAKKALSEAKTLEDAFTLFSTLKVEKAEPVIAAKGAEGGQTGGGIVMGAGKIEGKAPTTVKVEEVGNYNPYTRKYEPTFREEVID